jgi:hypothetical protein
MMVCNLERIVALRAAHLDGVWLQDGLIVAEHSAARRRGMSPFRYLACSCPLRWQRWIRLNGISLCPFPAQGGILELRKAVLKAGKWGAARSAAPDLMLQGEQLRQSRRILRQIGETLQILLNPGRLSPFKTALQVHPYQARQGQAPLFEVSGQIGL